jgi:hypothetical protein
MKDPIVEEVRAARMAHTKKFNYDLAAICADLKRIESESGHKLVSRKPKLVKRQNVVAEETAKYE